ncbi:MAG: hypothetical protein JWM03_1702, partial [Rhodocyclales bacterium]|nr:hypothetical protein [Rhodocyclales bacterium]
ELVVGTYDDEMVAAPCIVDAEY